MESSLRYSVSPAFNMYTVLMQNNSTLMIISGISDANSPWETILEFHVLFRKEAAITLQKRCFQCKWILQEYRFFIGHIFYVYSKIGLGDLWI